MVESIKTIDVFGVSNSNIKSYVDRSNVDSLFIRGLESNKHIVIFGSSKQGKTALTNKHLKKGDFIRVNCSTETRPVDIYKSILRQLGVELKINAELNKSTEYSFGGSVKADVSIPFLSGGAEGSTQARVADGQTTQYKRVEYDLSLPQDVSEILIEYKFKQRIILENFHYLSEEVQNDLAVHLRVFEDSSILFIILGIWREKNRLTQFNGDLQDRLIEIPVEPWENNDFKQIIEIGQKLLNVNFDEIYTSLVELSFDSVGVFQELCKETCLAAGVDERSHVNPVYLNSSNLETAKQKKLTDYSGRHIRSLETFIEPNRSSDESRLYLPYYFIKFLFSQNFEDIFIGFKRDFIHSGIKNMHHRKDYGEDDVPRPSDMSYFLHNIVSSQIKKNIVPPLFDYDRSNRMLKIIDSTFYFFIRNANLNDIFSSFNAPENI
jgi:hypothetical protein